MAPKNTFLSSLSFLRLVRVLGKFSVLSSALFALNSQSNWLSNPGQVSFELPDGSTWSPIELSNDSSQSKAPSFQVVIPRFLSRKSPTLDSFWKSMWELLVVVHSSPSMGSRSVLRPHLLSSAGSILSPVKVPWELMTVYWAFSWPECSTLSWLLTTYYSACLFVWFWVDRS